jgi:dTDP-4-dehydrorhamnose 3,5-epimerase
MQFSESPIAGAWVVEPTPHNDDRGRFMRAWCADEFAAHGIEFRPVQSNMGFSHRAGTTRGLHYQVAPNLEAKLVRCTRGSVFDVLVDLRPNSATFGDWFGTELSAENGRMLYVPPMCAHGVQTLEDASEIYYMASSAFAPASVRGIRFDDPALGIRWPLAPVAISDQDSRWPYLEHTKAQSR